MSAMFEFRAIHGVWIPAIPAGMTAFWALTGLAGSQVPAWEPLSCKLLLGRSL